MKGKKVYIVYSHNGAMIDEILAVYAEKDDARELYEDNKERFPHQNFDYEEWTIL